MLVLQLCGPHSTPLHIQFTAHEPVYVCVFACMFVFVLYVCVCVCWCTRTCLQRSAHGRTSFDVSVLKRTNTQPKHSPPKLAVVFYEGAFTVVLASSYFCLCAMKTHTRTKPSKHSPHQLAVVFYEGAYTVVLVLGIQVRGGCLLDDEGGDLQV